jgi:hypothetical protein
MLLNIFKRKTIPLNKHRKIVKHLHEELLRKDSIIEGLKKEKDLLLKTALKQSSHTQKWQEKANKLIQKKKNLK